MSTSTNVCGICARGQRMVMEAHEARPGVKCGGSGMTHDDSHDHENVLAHNTTEGSQKAPGAVRLSSWVAACEGTALGEPMWVTGSCDPQAFAATWLERDISVRFGFWRAALERLAEEGAR